jgi:hypothetical protein
MKPFASIDLGRLEQEWLLQPKLYDKYATKLAGAKELLAKAEAFLEVTEAEVKLEIRKKPLKFGFADKITEGVVKELLVTDKRYRDALQAVNSTKHDVDVLAAVINTLEHRKRALESLVTLHGQNYFSKPKVSKEAGDAARSAIESHGMHRGTKMKSRKNPS